MLHQSRQASARGYTADSTTVPSTRDVKSDKATRRRTNRSGQMHDVNCQPKFIEFRFVPPSPLTPTY
jgi:hypothetical protein